MWNFSLEEVKLGIRASMKEYVEWYHGGDSEISRKMVEKQKIILFLKIIY